MTIDHAFYNALRADIETAYGEIAERHGLKSLKLGRITVDSMGGFRAALTGVTRSGASPEETFYSQSREWSPRALPAIGEDFKVANVAGRVTGRKTRGNQRVTYTRASDGKSYLVDFEQFAERFPYKSGREERPSEHAMRLARSSS